MVQCIVTKCFLGKHQFIEMHAIDVVLMMSLMIHCFYRQLQGSTGYATSSSKSIFQSRKSLDPPEKEKGNIQS
jgi:hypothetical protein